MSIRWRERADDRHNELFQVVTMRDGRIVEMRDYRRRSKALGFLA